MIRMIYIKVVYKYVYNVDLCRIQENLCGVHTLVSLCRKNMIMATLELRFVTANNNKLLHYIIVCNYISKNYIEENKKCSLLLCIHMLFLLL